MNYSIGTKNESSLHRALKLRYAGPDGEERTEARIGSYVCDAIGEGDEAIEIQTGGFGALKHKIPALAAAGRVRLIYPVIVSKIIELYDTGGNLVSRKKSPRRGGVFDIFGELIYAPNLAGLRRLTVELALVDALERRRDDGKGSWRRRGISIEDRSLETWRESVVLAKRADWRRLFLPLKGEFTIKDLALAVRIRPVLARKTLYVMEKTGFVEKIRKKGRSWVFRKKTKT